MFNKAEKIVSYPCVLQQNTRQIYLTTWWFKFYIFGPGAEILMTMPNLYKINLRSIGLLF